MISCMARGRHSGFTLIEIMIVIAIIAILAGIVVPNIAMARAEARLESCRQNILAIADAYCMARIRYSIEEITGKPERVSVSDQFTVIDSSCFLVENGYLNEPLQCPAGKFEKGQSYSISVYDENRVCIDCGPKGMVLTHYVGDKKIHPRYFIGEGFRDIVK